MNPHPAVRLVVSLIAAATVTNVGMTNRLPAKRFLSY